MSRIANQPINLPEGVQATLQGCNLTVKGGKGTLERELHPSVELSQEGDVLTVSAKDSARQSVAMAGTTRALVANMVQGVSNGFEKKLTLFGVGYRAQVSGKKLNLTLGFSHPVEYQLPEEITVETPSQTEIVVKGIDKQVVGQTAANIRSYRPPEPYKGKGVRYADEHVVRKEAKKK